MAREISSLRDRTSQLDAELEATKRHLSNERYERWVTSAPKTCLKIKSSLYSRYYAKACNNSDDRMVTASASGVVDLGLIASQVKPMTLKLLFTAFLLDPQH